MLLLLDNEVYYEFLPVEEWNKEQPVTIPLEGVEVGKQYAIANNNKWRSLAI